MNTGADFFRCMSLNTRTDFTLVLDSFRTGTTDTGSQRVQCMATIHLDCGAVETF